MSTTTKAASPVKKAKTTEDGGECVVPSDHIPVKHVTRMFHLKVAGEPEAVKADAIIRKVWAKVKPLEGVLKSYRFICKEHWDVKFHMIFEGPGALDAYMNGDVRKNEVLPLLKELEALAKDGHVHYQNFVADEWE